MHLRKELSEKDRIGKQILSICMGYCMLRDIGEENTWFNIDKVFDLLKEEANVNVQAQVGNFTALHYAVWLQDAKLLQALLDKKANPNLPDAEGKTPLHHAVSLNNAVVIQLLIQHGADINMPDCLGNTPLFDVKGQENFLILMASGADFNIRNNEGVTFYENLEYLYDHTDAKKVALILNNQLLFPTLYLKVIDKLQNEPENFNKNLEELALFKDYQNFPKNNFFNNNSNLFFHLTISQQAIPVSRDIASVRCDKLLHFNQS
jgi:ankyrin repeat protein